MKLKEKLTEWVLLFYLGLIIAGLLASVGLASAVLFLLNHTPSGESLASF